MVNTKSIFECNSKNTQNNIHMTFVYILDNEWMPPLNLLSFKIVGTLEKIFAHNVQPIIYFKKIAQYELRYNSPFKLFCVTNV